MVRSSWRTPLSALVTTAALAASATAAQAAIRAPGTVANPKQTATAGTPCTAGGIHCYTPQQMRDAFGVSALPNKGDGQTIVLVDSYGTPTGAQDLQTFHDTFFANEPDPNFDEVYPNGKPNYTSCNGNGTQHSGPCAAAGWAGEASLDIEWAYAMAPHAHIVLLAVPPAETLGVQGMPNLFKAISNAIDTYPSGTVFSMSFGFPEQDFTGGSARSQIAKYDAVFQKGLDKGDTFFASSGDDGSTGTAKQQHESRSFSEPTVGYPASSPYVTAVGGTQLQYHWTWDPSSDVPFTAAGDFNPAYFAANPDASNRNVVWNESWLPAATGGGSSVLYERPSWQSSVASRITDTDGNEVNARGLPDLAWNAAVNGGVLTYESDFPADQAPGFHIYGGTSASSPQIAGVVALANEQRHNAGKGPIGYLNPVLYGNGGAGVKDFVPTHQGAPGVVSGDLVNNRLFDYNGDGNPVTPGPVPGWPTTTGWDETTGFGTPDAPAFVGALTAAP
jgi:subtilase family serine protease